MGLKMQIQKKPEGHGGTVPLRALRVGLAFARESCHNPIRAFTAPRRI